MAKSDIENTQDSNAIGVVVQCPSSALKAPTEPGLWWRWSPPSGWVLVIVSQNPTGRWMQRDVTEGVDEWHHVAGYDRFVKLMPPNWKPNDQTQQLGGGK